MFEQDEARVLNVSDIDEFAYREVAPAPALRRFVECLWSAGRAQPADEADRRILPDGRMDLIWIRGAGVLIAGPQSRFTMRSRTAPLVAVGARFWPGAAPGLLRLPAADFVDGHVALEAVDSRLAGRLERRLEAARSLEQAFDAYNTELLRYSEQLADLDAAVGEATLMLNDPQTRVADVASQVFVSERQLRRRFAERVGYGPKTLQRVLRLQRLLGLLSSDEDLARVAVAAGYADQAHLTRECRELTGFTPAELARRVR